MSQFNTMDLTLMGIGLAATVWSLVMCICALFMTQQHLRISMAELSVAFARSLVQLGRRLKESERA